MAARYTQPPTHPHTIKWTVFSGGYLCDQCGESNDTVYSHYTGLDTIPIDICESCTRVEDLVEPVGIGFNPNVGIIAVFYSQSLFQLYKIWLNNYIFVESTAKI